MTNIKPLEKVLKKPINKGKTCLRLSVSRFMAEWVGFEPTEPKRLN